jgi:D-alanyl-lipoteichoic acid acyltransferase DltB (MBOAT superfamily)
MLFNSYEFIFAFLPLVVLVYFFLTRRSIEIAIVWLVCASVFFYGWWNPAYLPLIIISMLVNFGIGRVLAGLVDSHIVNRRTTLAIGISLNLGVLGYFKYADFFIDNLNAVTGSGIEIGSIVLPLAISFFTFQQIAYLVDAYQGVTREYRFWHYALFVTFFPQLIAGPIVHHSEMLPQFMKQENMRPRLLNLAVGSSIFAIGLFKKAVLADGVAVHSTPVFDKALTGSELTFFEAWGGALAYTMQLYFDFSGYSDMAIGAARIFGIVLPLNFYSPYKATSIVEFWRRWHITLSRFLRDYLYIPLGGNRCGKTRRYLNLAVTMLLGGLWHGAGWTFVVWGALHGIYLVINHAWTRLRRSIGGRWNKPSAVGRALSWLLTFFAVVVGWVFFRAESFDAAIGMLTAMSGWNGIAIPAAIFDRLGPLAPVLQHLGVGRYYGGGSRFVFTYLWILFLLPIALLMPNTQQIMRRYRPVLRRHRTPDGAAVVLGGRTSKVLLWRPSLFWSAAIGVMLAVGILALTSVSEFLYFQF